MDAKQKVVAAIYGDLKESYVELPRVLAGLKDASPGTNYKLLVDDNYEQETCTFKSVFWAFRPFIVGFVDTHFLNPCPKAHTEENPMKSKAQRPTKKTEKQERSKERSVRERDLQQNTNLPQNIVLWQNDFGRQRQIGLKTLLIQSTLSGP